MEALILDTNLQAIDIVDVFESMIWTERYYGFGDFEIYTSAEIKHIRLLKQDRYVYLADSEAVMIIESVQINSDVEDGNRITVIGRSLESILERRIIWTQTKLSGNFQNGIERLLNENIINPIDPDRRIDNFIFEASTDPVITALTIETQFTGDNLYSAIKVMCEANSIGFKVTLTDDNKFKFKLYSGIDRSYEQLANPYIVFSPNFDNLLNSNYLESKKSLKNVTLVAGEGEGLERKTTVVGSGSGIDRRELFTDARDISKTVDEVELTDEEYTAQLAQRGTEKLTENVEVKTFEGPVKDTSMYTYGVDFNMGDIVQLANEYGVETRVRVTELVRSQSPEGVDIYPTFIDVSK